MHADHLGFSTESSNFHPKPARRRGRKRRRKPTAVVRPRTKYEYADPTWQAVLRNLQGGHLRFHADLADGSRFTFTRTQVLALAKVANRLVSEYTRGEIATMLRGVA